ncbi:MAG: hypothetical protein ACXAEU_11600 [Candidatus Hodarchaeales archaeon]
MTKNEWTSDHSRSCYGIGERTREFHFLDINEEGQLCLKIHNKTISIVEILERLHANNDDQRGQDQVPSVTLRVPQLIEHQVNKLKNSFQALFNQLDYSGEFAPVYPIKVNQLAYMVRAVLEYGGDKYGLEAGTESELAICLEMLKDRKEQSTIVCNGVKDINYFTLIDKKLLKGYNIIVSIESMREIETLLQILTDPSLVKLALRIKPYFPVSGHWGKSSGRDSKFGLSIGELHKIIDFLLEKDYAHLVTTIHTHIGSQITSTNDFKTCAKYMTRMYKELRELGLTNLASIDFGGGLSIDYKGIKSGEEEDIFKIYAEDLVKGILSEIDLHPHPNIIVEAGRAITAPASMVAVQILEIRDLFPEEILQGEDLETFQHWKEKIFSINSFEDFVDVWVEFESTWLNADIHLKSIKQAELLVGHFYKFMREFLASDYDRLNLNEHLNYPWLKEAFTLADKIAIGNFSVFNSACDHVLVDQYFPVFPIEKLDRKPETIIRLVDITCDSDGELSVFITKTGKELSFTGDGYPLCLRDANIQLQGIPVPEINTLNESYFLIGLLGAYQDVIQFDHNLIGGLPEAEIFLEDDKWKISWLSGPEKLDTIVRRVGHEISLESANLDKSSYVIDTWNRKRGKKAEAEK